MLKKFCLLFGLTLLAANIFARDVKVLISENKNNVSLTASAPFKLKNLDNNKTYKITQRGTFTVGKEKGQVICGNQKSKTSFPRRDHCGFHRRRSFRRRRGLFLNSFLCEEKEESKKR